MQVLQIKCPNCGSDLEMNMDKLMAFCPYCRAKLPLDVNVEHVVSEKEQTKRKEMEEETKRIISEQKQENESLRVWRFLWQFVSVGHSYY